MLGGCPGHRLEPLLPCRSSTTPHKMAAGGESFSRLSQGLRGRLCEPPSLNGISKAEINASPHNNFKLTWRIVLSHASNTIKTRTTTPAETHGCGDEPRGGQALETLKPRLVPAASPRAQSPRDTLTNKTPAWGKQTKQKPKKPKPPNTNNPQLFPLPSLGTGGT